jgi:hypothetical protein
LALLVIFLGLLAAAPFLALAPTGLGEPAAAVCISGFALAALAIDRPRAAMDDLLATFAAPISLFTLYLTFSALQAGLLGAPAFAANAGQAQSETADLAALGLAALMAAALSRVNGFRLVTAGTLAGGVIFGLANALLLAANRTDVAEHLAAGTVLGVLAIFAAFALADELSRRGRSTDRRPLAPLPQRLILPSAALIISLQQTAATAPAPVWMGTLAGIGAVGAIWAIRERRGGRPLFRLTALACAGGIAALTAVLGMRIAFGPPEPLTGAAANLASPLAAIAEAGPFGFGLGMANLAAPFGQAPLLAGLAWDSGALGTGLIVLAIAALVFMLDRREDRGRTPSRGLALAAGLIAFLLATGLSFNALATPAAGLLIAVGFGIAASLTDRRGPAVNVHHEQPLDPA